MVKPRAFAVLRPYGKDPPTYRIVVGCSAKNRARGYTFPAGKALFKDVRERQALKLERAKPLKSGKVALTYSTQR